MDFLKEPAIIFCIILLFIIICVAVYLHQRAISPLTERTSALEEVLSTITKEGADFREKSKQVPRIIDGMSEQQNTIEILKSTIASLNKEVKEQGKYISYLVEELSKTGSVPDIKPYRSKVLPKKKKKKSVSFRSDSDTEEEEDSEEDVRDIRKALEAKKRK